MSEATSKSAQRSNKAVRGSLPPEGTSGALYEVTKRTHKINGRDYEPGEKVFWAGTPGVLLKPLNDEAKAAVKEADAARAKEKAAAESKKNGR